MRWLLVALVLLPLLASGAHAQLPVSPSGVPATLGVSVEDPGHPLAPGKIEALDILLNYAVPPGGQPAPDPSDQNNASKPTFITFAVKTVPSWVVNVTFDPPVANISVPFPSASGQYPAQAKALLLIAPDAPALDKKEFVITATSSQNGNIAPATGTSPSINIKPAFVAKVNVSGPSSLVVPGGRWTDVQFLVKNLGNGEQKVKLNVTARPQDSQVDFPQSVTIPVNASQVVTVRLRVPWTYGEQGTVELEATPLLDGDEGKPSHAAIDVNGQSAVPGTGLAVALLAILALAASRRRS